MPSIVVITHIQILALQRSEELEEEKLRMEEGRDKLIAEEAEKKAKQAEEAERLAEEERKRGLENISNESKEEVEWVLRSR